MCKIRPARKISMLKISYLSKNTRSFSLRRIPGFYCIRNQKPWWDMFFCWYFSDPGVEINYRWQKNRHSSFRQLSTDVSNYIIIAVFHQMRFTCIRSQTPVCIIISCRFFTQMVILLSWCLINIAFVWDHVSTDKVYPILDDNALLTKTLNIDHYSVVHISAPFVRLTTICVEISAPNNVYITDILLVCKDDLNKLTPVKAKGLSHDIPTFSSAKHEAKRTVDGQLTRISEQYKLELCLKYTDTPAINPVLTEPRTDGRNHV